MIDWAELKDLQAVAKAQTDGWEIELYNGIGSWLPWNGQLWNTNCQYRGRPKHPKKVTVTVPCYFTGNGLQWSLVARPEWTRCPERDMVVEVEE